AAVVSLNKDGSCDRVSVVLSGVRATPLRLSEIEKGFHGKSLDERGIEEAGQLAYDEGREPLSDIHATSDYRREMSRIYTKRAIRLAAARAGARETKKKEEGRRKTLPRVTVKLRVNHEKKEVEVDTRTLLVDLLRD